jgi:ribose/xylose/arabinose/galactoside ABC-type transport system permease subunit
MTANPPARSPSRARRTKSETARPASDGSRSALDSLGVLNPVGWFRPTSPAGSDRDGHRRRSDRLLDLGIYVALIALVGYFWQASPYFMTQRNLLNVGSAVAVTGVLAAGMTIALIAGQLDLTVGANIALTSVVVSLAVESLGWSTPLAVLLGLTVGVAIGLVNTALVVGIGINSIIATLALGIVIRGIALISTGGQTKPLTNLALPDFLQARPLGVPTSVWILAVVFLLSWVVLSFTRAGWHIYGVGGNPSAALRAGVRTKRLYAGVFVTTGVLAALGGVITAGTSSSGGPNYANGAEFDVLTAVLLGGIGLAGGSGRIQRTLAGVLVIGVINNGLTLMSVNSYYQQLARGAVFVLAVILGAIGERRRAR